MKLSLLNKLKFAWLAVCFTVLFYSLNRIGYGGEAQVLPFLFLMLWTFPAGIGVAYLIAFAHLQIYQLTSESAPITWFSISLEWVLFVLFGYLQYFVVVPFIIRRFERDK